MRPEAGDAGDETLPYPGGIDEAHTGHFDAANASHLHQRGIGPGARPFDTMTVPGCEGHDAKHPAMAATILSRTSPMNDAGSSEARSQYLSFLVAGEEYGVAILRVVEILEDRPSSRLSAMPILDLAEHFGLRPTPALGRGCIVVVELLVDGEPAVIGLVATVASGVLELSHDAIEPPPSLGTAVPADSLDGMARVGRRFITLLNIDRVLSAHGRNSCRMESERSVITSVEAANG
jgi:purine-binding chemotaxis protein CheW